MKQQFLRTFSFRELLSILVSLSFFFSVSSFIRRTNIENVSTFIFITFFISLIINHLLYCIEHKRSNTFFGRVVLSTFFFLVAILFFTVDEQIYLFEFSYFIIGFVAIVVFETIISPINKVFPKYRYQKISKIKSLSLAIILLLLYTVNLIMQKETYTYWRKLNWDDFNFKPDKSSEHDAGLTLKIIVDYDTIANKYISNAVSINELAWKKKDFKEDLDLLEHEQYHFDIAEYYSRKMNNYLKNNIISSKFDYSHELANIRMEHENFQELYDFESDHNFNDKEQKKWAKKIDSLLNGGNLESTKKIESSKRKRTEFTRYWTVNKVDDKNYNETEIYVALGKDTVFNQYKTYKNGILDTIRSHFFELHVSKNLNDTVYLGNLKLFSSLDYEIKSKLLKRELTLHVFQKKSDSIYTRVFKSKNSNEIKFDYYQYKETIINALLFDNRTYEGSKINGDEMVRLTESMFFVDSKYKTQNPFIEAFEDY